MFLQSEEFDRYHRNNLSLLIRNRHSFCLLMVYVLIWLLLGVGRGVFRLLQLEFAGQSSVISSVEKHSFRAKQEEEAEQEVVRTKSGGS